MYWQNPVSNTILVSEKCKLTIFALLRGSVCSIQAIPKLRFCNLGCRLLLNQHHQNGSRRPRMFRPYSMNTLVAGGPTVVINHCTLVDRFQLISSRLSHSQLVARSAAWLSIWKPLFLSLPLVPTAVISLHTDWGQKPLAHTSTGNSQYASLSLYKDPVALCT